VRRPELEVVANWTAIGVAASIMFTGSHTDVPVLCVLFLILVQVVAINNRGIKL
jgi:hypothetical protein